MESFKQFNEARMSAAVKLQRALERERVKSDASRRRGEEVMAQARAEAEKKMKTPIKEGTTQINGTDKLEIGVSEIATKKKTDKEMEDQQNESWTFDTAAMAKQELADAKNKKHRKRGKVANLLRKLGMKEGWDPEKFGSDGSGAGGAGAGDISNKDKKKKNKPIEEAKKAEDDVPFDGPYTKGPKKDEFGNTVKPKNVAKFLAKRAMRKLEGKPVKEEVEQLEEANHREFASQGKMHPDMAKHMTVGQHQDYYEPKTGDKVHGKVVHKSDTEVHVRKTHDSYDDKKVGDVHKFKIKKSLDEVLSPSMGAGAYIDDFVHSKNPKFAGKSKDKRQIGRAHV